jgi:NADP-dependent 3-hydroxy acid dehydrogenase YdfG
LTGPLIVITGASSGIGLALARAFAKEGNALLLIARHMKPIDGLPAERTVYAQADVADHGALEHAIRDAEATFGKTACLINNAGMADARAFTEVEPAAFSHEIDVNLKGTLNATKVVIGDMTAAGSGTIINISSVSDRKTSPTRAWASASRNTAASSVIPTSSRPRSWRRSCCTAGSCRRRSASATSW